MVSHASYLAQDSIDIQYAVNSNWQRNVYSDQMLYEDAKTFGKIFGPRAVVKNEWQRE